MNEESTGADVAGLPVSRRPERVLVWLHVALWLGLIGASVYLLGPWKADQAKNFEHYRILLAAGFVLTASGPALGLIGWFIFRQGTGGDEPNRLGRVMFNIVGTGLLGVASWTITLLTLDYIRTGLG